MRRNQLVSAKGGETKNYSKNTLLRRLISVVALCSITLHTSSTTSSSCVVQAAVAGKHLHRAPFRHRSTLLALANYITAKEVDTDSDKDKASGKASASASDTASKKANKAAKGAKGSSTDTPFPGQSKTKTILERLRGGQQQPEQQRSLALWGVTALFDTRRSIVTVAVSDATKSTLERLRGGDDSTLVDSDSEDEDEDSEVEDETDTEDVDVIENKEDKDDNVSNSPLASVMSMEPVPVTIKTALGNIMLDQSVELTVNRSRNVASLKQSLSRQLLGRPPVAALRLTLAGKVLDDDVLVDELVDDDDEEEDDDDDEEEEGGRRLVLQLDMVPPVDPKFFPQLERYMEEITTSDLLDAYTVNEAAVYHNAALLMQEAVDEHDGNDEDEDEDDEPVVSSSSNNGVLVSLQIRQQAARMRHDLEEQLLSSKASQELLQDTTPPHQKMQQSQTEIQVRGDRVRTLHAQAASGGVHTSLRLTIQRNLNINWGDSIRYFCLFLFFGHFGGRTPASRAILLLGAPAVFVLQARPVKLYMKQLLYAFLDQPPAILLSLLPAPQQAILSLRMGEAMEIVYGPYAGPGSIYFNENDDNDQEEAGEIEMEKDDVEMDDLDVEEDDLNIYVSDDEEEEDDYDFDDEDE